MKSFKKFTLITLLPIVLIALISIAISQSFEGVSNLEINLFILGALSIISFCYVYLFENQKK